MTKHLNKEHSLYKALFGGNGTRCNMCPASHRALDMYSVYDRRRRMEAQRQMMRQQLQLPDWEEK